MCERKSQTAEFLPVSRRPSASGWSGELAASRPFRVLHSSGSGQCPASVSMSARTCLGQLATWASCQRHDWGCAYGAVPISWGPASRNSSGQGEGKPVGGGTSWMSQDGGRGSRQSGAVNSLPPCCLPATHA